MDRIDKTLLVLPFIPPVDMVSTLFSLSFGGKEVGSLAKPIYERYGELGLLAWSTFLFFIFLACVWRIKYWKRRFTQESVSKTYRIILLVGINIVFLAEASWIGLVIQNLFVPFLNPLTLYPIWATLVFIYFVSVSFFTRNEMKQIIRG